jgi:hypothetical protein
VLQTPRGKRRDAEKLTANSTGGRRGGGDGAGRWTAAGRGGASPVTSPWRCGARRRKRVTPKRTLPRSDVPGDLHGGGETADGVAHGGPATLGLRRRRRLRARVWGREGGGAAGRRLYRPGGRSQRRVGPQDRARAAQTSGRARLRLRSGAGEGMTGGARLSATAGGNARGWATLGRKLKGCGARGGCELGRQFCWAARLAVQGG